MIKKDGTRVRMSDETREKIIRSYNERIKYNKENTFYRNSKGEMTTKKIERNKKKSYKEFINNRITNIKEEDFKTINHENIAEGKDYIFSIYELHGKEEIKTMNIIIIYGHEEIIVYHTKKKIYNSFYIR